MLKRMAPSLAERCIDDARRSPLSDPVVHYPQWYLQRWHFLPEGYLSRRSAAGYERVIRNFYNAASEGRVLDALAEVVAQQAPRSVVELGCGPGRGLAALAAWLPECTLSGLDLSPFMLERAERRLEQSAVGATLIHGSGMESPLASGAFDAAVATHFFGHLPRAAAVRAWGEAVRILKPGGRLYVVDHAWHPRLAEPLTKVRSVPLLRGVLRFTVLRKAGAS